jgi:1-acyl-sn-glycerol-3-phosphate acyltransferase
MSPPGTDKLVFRVGKRLLDPLARYHHHRVEGMEHVPRSGPALCVLHHSFATYDAFLVGLRVMEDVGRFPYGLGDNQLFRFPPIRPLLDDLHIRPAEPGAALALLRQGELVFVAPGGMREALRPYSRRYEPDWHDRKGFVRLALRAQVPVVLFACPAADRIYTVYDLPLTERFYQRFHLPLALVRGVGPTLVPRPVRLTHHISEPIPPPPDDADDPEAVDRFHAVLVARMRELLTLR